MYAKVCKRGLDVILAVSALLFLFPVFIVLSVLVRIRLGNPVFFRQIRPGKDEKLFELIKFRTMTDDVDEQGNQLPDEQRLPSFGQWLRSTSLDELPELWNILKGDMSFVGPRPLLVQYLPLYDERQRRRHELLPGLTGWAQVNGRNMIPWEDRFELDVWYIENVSFLVDVRIVFLTFQKLVKREGISSQTSATMEPFMGTREKTRV